ncbi:MAG: two-component system sensor protein [Rhodoglobus sp.]|nr:two-component system sensor protein [Rhodoglobus sp.]
MSESQTHISPDSADALDWDAIVGRRVFHIMWDKKITQTALGRSVGIDQSSLGKRLRGERGWSLSDLKVVAAAIGTTAEELLREGPDMTPTVPEEQTKD